MKKIASMRYKCQEQTRKFTIWTRSKQTLNTVYERITSFLRVLYSSKMYRRKIGS